MSEVSGDTHGSARKKDQVTFTHFYSFYTPFECSFTSSPPVRSVVLHPPYSFRVQFYIFSTRSECSFTSSPLVPSVVLHLPHSFRVQFYIFPTRFECFFLAIVRVHPDEWKEPISVASFAQAISSRDIHVKLHSKRVEEMRNYTRNEWRRCETTLETSREDAKLHSKLVEKM